LRKIVPFGEHAGLVNDIQAAARRRDALRSVFDEVCDAEVIDRVILALNEAEACLRDRLDQALPQVMAQEERAVFVSSPATR